jgi:uncharacterized damage-inducible protein DinB
MTSVPDLLGRLARLEAQRSALLESLAGLEEQRLRRPSRPGGWSILEILGHLRLVEQGSLAYLRKKLQDPAAIPRADFRSALRLGLIAAVLRSPLRLKAPERVARPPADTTFAEARREWDEVRRGWRDLVEGFPPELVGRAVYRHPFAGRLTLAHTLGFLAEHFRHHRRQIDRLRAAAP